MLSQVLVLGVLGQVGSLVATSLRNSGLSVTGVDLAPDHPDPSVPYLSADLLCPTPALAGALAAADCVCLCLPELLTISIAEQIVRTMGDGALWVDTLSVKTGIAPILEIHSERIEALSINPMFAPGLGWNAKPVAVVPFRSGTKASRFLELLSSWGARIEMLSADRHDRITSTIQAATHAAVLAFGASLLSLEYDAEAALRLATPPHRILLGLLARMLAQNPEVYWDIQAHHPHATRVRSELISCLQRLDDASREPSPEHFDTLFGRLKDLLRSQQPELTDLARRLVNAVVQDR